jgi:nucleoid DNA-binding protein
VIKLDIVNEVVNRTGVTKTKAEIAVETVFGSMKKALENGDRIELRGFGVFNVKPRKTGRLRFLFSPKSQGKSASGLSRKKLLIR